VTETSHEVHEARIDRVRSTADYRRFSNAHCMLHSDQLIRRDTQDVIYQDAVAMGLDPDLTAAMVLIYLVVDNSVPMAMVIMKVKEWPSLRSFALHLTTHHGRTDGLSLWFVPPYQQRPAATTMLTSERPTRAKTRELAFSSSNANG
jgi:hypothetical protein